MYCFIIFRNDIDGAITEQTVKFILQLLFEAYDFFKTCVLLKGKM